MQTILRRAIVVALLFLVSACASGVTRPGGMAASQPALMGNQKAGQITLEMNSQAHLAAVQNLSFNKDKLLMTVRQALEAQNALSLQPNAQLPTIEITLTDVRTRSGFAAVMFGFMAGDDHINGDVVVRSPAGAEMQRFSVSASYALGGFAGGQDDARMNWLYEAFAKHIVEELTGRRSG